MKKLFFAILFLFLSIGIVLPVHSAGYTDFYATLPGAGWAEKSASLNIRISAILCTNSGVCMANGFGYASDSPSDLVHFGGDILNNGQYLHVWLKGDGRGSVNNGTQFINYDIYIKINLSNPVSSMNTFSCKSTSVENGQPWISTGHVTITFY